MRGSTPVDFFLEATVFSSVSKYPISKKAQSWPSADEGENVKPNPSFTNVWKSVILSTKCRILKHLQVIGRVGFLDSLVVCWPA